MWTRGAALCPGEVAARPYTGGFAEGEKDRGDGVRPGGGVSVQDAVPVDLDTPYLQYLAEHRRVDHVDLQEQHVCGAGDRVGAALLALFLGVLLCAVAGLMPVGDEVQGVVVGQGVGDELPCGKVELDAVGAQLGSPGHP